MTKQTQTNTFVLPVTVDHDVCRELAEFAAEHRGLPLTINASEARQVGALAAQTLAMAATTWAADGVPFLVSDTSGRLAANLAELCLAGTIPITEHHAKMNQAEGETQ